MPVRPLSVSYSTCDGSRFKGAGRRLGITPYGGRQMAYPSSGLSTRPWSTRPFPNLLEVLSRRLKKKNKLGTGRCGAIAGLIGGFLSHSSCLRHKGITWANLRGVGDPNLLPPYDTSYCLSTYKVITAWQQDLVQMSEEPSLIKDYGTKCQCCV